ncbi:hypothetical protein L7F22_024342 [Adiantum nelumboides]|nr:hypothetical protein [Adiantum nelumboides]
MGAGAEDGSCTTDLAASPGLHLSFAPSLLFILEGDGEGLEREGAFHEDTCLGTIVCKMGQHRNTYRGYIAMLVVIKPFRGRGIATELVTRSIQNMRDAGCEEVTLEAEVTNKGALALYGNLGFTRAKRLYKYYLNGVDAFKLKLLFPLRYDQRMLSQFEEFSCQDSGHGDHIDCHGHGPGHGDHIGCHGHGPGHDHDHAHHHHAHHPCHDHSNHSGCNHSHHLHNDHCSHLHEHPGRLVAPDSSHHSMCAHHEHH